MHLSRQQQRAADSALMKGQARHYLALALADACSVLGFIEQAELATGAPYHAGAAW